MIFDCDRVALENISVFVCYYSFAWWFVCSFIHLVDGFVQLSNYSLGILFVCLFHNLLELFVQSFAQPGVLFVCLFIHLLNGLFFSHSFVDFSSACSFILSVVG